MSSDHDYYRTEYKPNFQYDPECYDPENRRSYISESSITRREIPSDGSLKTDSDPDDPDNSKQDRQRNVLNVNKRVSRDDNMIQINRSFIHDLDTETLLGNMTLFDLEIIIKRFRRRTKSSSRQNSFTWRNCSKFRRI